MGSGGSWADGPGDREGMVFRAAGDLWVNVRFDREAFVAEYVRLAADMVTRIRVALTPSGDAASTAEVRYAWTAVTEAGNAQVAAKKADAETMMDWEEDVNAALARRRTAERGTMNDER